MQAAKAPTHHGFVRPRDRNGAPLDNRNRWTSERLVDALGRYRNACAAANSAVCAALRRLACDLQVTHPLEFMNMRSSECHKTQGGLTAGVPVGIWLQLKVILPAAGHASCCPVA